MSNGTPIEISTAEVRGAADKIVTINTQLKDKFDKIIKEMNALENTWKSEAASTIKEKFSNFTPRFNEYQEVVKSYADFLKAVAERYEGEEDAIKSYANQFK
ncbi:pore-forming ESAT-6 family protein [Paenibacillus sp. GCM10027627]|uniref:pore-forming ESAT-6 family protein n=1 Tax=unclassified Paenibacillus TaxID=185978 RepID=UPI00363ECB24